MTVYIPELWLGACLGAVAAFAAIVGLAAILGRQNRRRGMGR